MASATTETMARGGSWLIKETAPASVMTPEQITEEHQLIRQAASEFIAGEVLPANERLEQKDWALQRELIAWVRQHIGPIVTPDLIQFVPGLPKTRSGKIMRRILRKLAEGETSLQALGDISTLADPTVVEALVAGRGSVR